MYESYKQLLAEINLHKYLYEAHETSYKYWNKKFDATKPKGAEAQQYSDMPHGSKDLPDTIDIMCKAIAFKNAMDEEKQMIDKLETHKKMIDETVELMDVTVKVKRLRAMGLTQEQVAELVDRHVNTVQNIEKRMKKEEIVG